MKKFLALFVFAMSVFCFSQAMAGPETAVQPSGQNTADIIKQTKEKVVESAVQAKDKASQAIDDIADETAKSAEKLKKAVEEKIYVTDEKAVVETPESETVTETIIVTPENAGKPAADDRTTPKQ